MSRLAERYKLIERLGAGSVGVVHRALDRATGREVAMKVMPRPHGATNLRDEFVVMARLRHPNIVSVLDYGLTDAGHEYFTMELISGRSLLQAARWSPENPHPFFELVDGAVDALSFIHARGLVHADLKPSNLLVDDALIATSPAAATKLADFGLAMALSDPAARAARGTLAYAAPEAWAGRADVRSDVYALGVVLYELATGERAFPGSTARDVLAAQRRAAPRDPRQIRESVPAGVAELILSMCDPEPSARPQSAEEARQRLDEAAIAIGVRARRRNHASAASAQVALSTPLVGRARELADLERIWRDARTGRGSVVLLVGEEGMGTSRLAAELALRVQLDGGQVARAAASGDSAWAGIDHIAQQLAATARQHFSSDGPRDQAIRRALAPLVAKRGEAGGAVRWSVAEALTELVAAAARDKPLVLIIDDVHLASTAAADCLAYLARAAPELPLMLLLAGQRRGDAADPVNSAAVLASRGYRIDVPPFDRSSTIDLATSAIGATAAAKLGDDLHRATGGNPGHVLGAISLLVQNEQLRRVTGSWIAEGKIDVPLPPTALEAAERRILLLSPATRAIIAIASLFGAHFDRELLAAAIGVLPEEEEQRTEPGFQFSDAIPEPLHEHVSVSVSVPVIVPEGSDRTEPGADTEMVRRLHAARSVETVDNALAEAVAARLIQADPAAGTFQFVHPSLAKVLGPSVADDERRVVLGRALAALERRRDERRPVAPAQLASIYLAVGNSALALQWLTRAADAAADAGDPKQAIVFASEAMTLASGSEATQLTERIGELAAAAGDTDVALHHYQLAHGRAVGAEAQTRMAVAIADLHRRRGATDLAHSVLMRALTAARTGRLVRAEARCHLRVGWVLMARSDYKAATEHAVAGQLLARTAGDRNVAAELGRLAAAIAIYQGDPRRALVLLESAVSDADVAGDERLRAGVLHEIGRALIHAGDYAKAAASLEHAVSAAESSGDVEQRAKSLNNLGAAYYFVGDWSAARRAWEQFRQLCERMGDQSELQYALNNLGSLYRELGMLNDARTILDRAAEVATVSGNAHIAAMILANRGEVEARDGDLAGARERYDRALLEFQRLGAKEDVIETQRRLAEVDLAVGRVDEAVARALETARDARDHNVRLEEGILHRLASCGLRLQGDLESARWFLERAKEISKGLNSRYELGRIALEGAALAKASGSTSDADNLLAEAEGIFVQLGARWDLARVRAERTSATEVHATVELGGTILQELVRTVGTVDVERVIELVLDRLLEVSGYERGFIILLDGDGRPRQRWRRTRQGARTFGRDDAEFSGTIVRRVAATGQAMAVRDTSADVDLREQHSVVALGLHRIMCAPLRIGGRVIGIVYVDSALFGDDKNVTVATLEALAAPLALAIENARLAAEEKHRSELMSILAHEIRNPLAGILGYSEMGMDAELGSQAQPQELFAKIRNDGERLRRLVDNVLELARHEAGNIDWSMSAVDVGRIARDVASTFRLACDRQKIQIAVEASGREGSALGNSDRIIQVVSNLIGNAIKFTSPGGKVTVTVSREAVKAGDPNSPPIPATEIRAWIPAGDDEVIGEFIRLDVADTGPGLTPELREQLFEKFKQGAGGKRTQGIGLGLYISREIVRRHAGSIWVESELGHGATFSVRLPIAL